MVGVSLVGGFFSFLLFPLAPDFPWLVTRPPSLITLSFLFSLGLLSDGFSCFV